MATNACRIFVWKLLEKHSEILLAKLLLIIGKYPLGSSRILEKNTKVDLRE
jgi:hypothetical protein